MKVLIQITCEPESNTYLCIAQAEVKPNLWKPYPFSDKKCYIKTTSFTELHEKLEDEFGGMDA